jgi:hypothetical protein
MQMPALEAVIALIVDNVSTWIEAQPCSTARCLNALRDLLAALELLRAPGVASHGCWWALCDSFGRSAAADESRPSCSGWPPSPWCDRVRSNDAVMRSTLRTSLELPVDADPLVVDNLLQELPQLSTEFAPASNGCSRMIRPPSSRHSGSRIR